VKLLLATDGSDDATVAMKTAARLLSPAVCTVDLLCVAPAFPKKWASASADYNYDQRILGESTHIVERARGHVKLNANLITTLNEIGSASVVIVDKTDNYDLTVIGANGWGAGGHVGLGPVASRVVEHALGSVLVGRDLRSEDGVRVLLAVDGSAASLHAVEVFRSLFDLSLTEICLMHVVETPWIQLGLEEDWATYSDEDKERSEAGLMEKELVREGDAAIEQVRNLLCTGPLSVTTRIDEGNPADEILSEAERGQYDLIVVGATGASDLKHCMLGSVSSKIAWNAPCSVLIARDWE
jgi:nucleotide-binding universal stress UspA family protein